MKTEQRMYPREGTTADKVDWWVESLEVVKNQPYDRRLGYFSSTEIEMIEVDLIPLLKQASEELGKPRAPVQGEDMEYPESKLP